MQDDALERPFHARGAVRADDLARAWGVTQPTVSRTLRRLGGRVVRLGRGRATRYALRRSAGRWGDRWPLYEVGADGRASLVGHLQALVARQWSLESSGGWPALTGEMFREGLYPDWPWFLDDLRPQGFLGSLFARRCALEMGLPADPRSWTADDVLAGLLRHGTDLPGAFVVGEAAMERVLSRRMEHQVLVARADIGPGYSRLAESVLDQEWPGSSAAGEQPKFTACVEESAGVVQQVIVKFSGVRPEDVRWADLLVCECLASEVLRAHGMAAAETALHQHAGRTFLESVRFDRAGLEGRRSVVSLAALDAAWFGEADTSWVDAAERLQREGWLPREQARELCGRWWFGRLIGNTDMHYGNVALFMSRQRPFALAPVYDMLPMTYRPGLEGRVSNEPLATILPTPAAEEAFAAAVVPAARFWQLAAEDARISPGFRELAARNADVIERCRVEAGVVRAARPASES